jgi:hypothetical protein
MFSRILVKLIDQAIVPALLLLAARVISVIVIGKKLGFDFNLNATGFSFADFSNYVTVNSYSTLVMIVILALGMIFVLAKSYFFHESHVTPGLSAKLFSFNLPSVIQSSFEIYSQGTIWLAYSYLLLIVCGIMTFFAFVFTWVFYISAVVTIILTVLLIIDIEHEVNILKNKDAEYDEDTQYLDQEGALRHA